MPKYACPICGDPNAFPLWIDAEPPDNCPEAMAGEQPRPRNITECRYQMRKARQRAEWMQQVPEAFDEGGAIRKEYGIGYVLERWRPANPDEPLTI